MKQQVCAQIPTKRNEFQVYENKIENVQNIREVYEKLCF
jgi:hypothetical protein